MLPKHTESSAWNDIFSEQEYQGYFSSDHHAQAQNNQSLLSGSLQ